MEQLPKWILTNPLPSIYDSESATAIEMVAKLYGAVQKIIDAFNDLETENKKFMADEQSSRSEFELNIEKVMRQFICEMNAELEKIDISLNEVITMAPDIIVEKVNTAIASGNINVTQMYYPETEELRIAVTGEV